MILSEAAQRCVHEASQRWKQHWSGYSGDAVRFSRWNERNHEDQSSETYLAQTSVCVGHEEAMQSIPVRYHICVWFSLKDIASIKITVEASNTALLLSVKVYFQKEQGRWRSVVNTLIRLKAETVKKPFYWCPFAQHCCSCVRSTCLLKLRVPTRAMMLQFYYCVF